MLEHICPTDNGLFHIQQTVFHDFLPSEVRILIVQRAGVKLLLHRFEICLWATPNLKRPGNHLLITLFQFRQTPGIFQSDLLIPSQSAVLVASLLGVPFFLYGLIAEVGILHSPGQIGQPMQPPCMDLSSVGTQFLQPRRCQMLRHNMLNAVVVIVQMGIDTLCFNRTIVLKSLK